MVKYVKVFLCNTEVGWSGQSMQIAIYCSLWHLENKQTLKLKSEPLELWHAICERLQHFCYILRHNEPPRWCCFHPAWCDRLQFFSMWTQDWRPPLFTPSCVDFSGISPVPRPTVIWMQFSMRSTGPMSLLVAQFSSFCDVCFCGVCCAVLCKKYADIFHFLLHNHKHHMFLLGYYVIHQHKVVLNSDVERKWCIASQLVYNE